jgi:hypothetical protein
MRTPITSAVTFDELCLRLCVSRAARCALLVHLGVQETIGAFVRRDHGALDFVAKEDCILDNPPAEVWQTIATMI